MKKILLVCGAGMSTSLLVKKMQETDIEHQYQIKCCDTVSAKIELLDHDIFLLAPHISYMKNEFQLLCEKSHIPFMVIDTLDYTKMDSVSIFNKVQKKLLMYEKEHPFHVVLLHSHAGAMSDLLLLDMNKKRKGEEVKWFIESITIDYFESDHSYNMILLEPQIRFEAKSLRKRIKNTFVIIDIPPMDIYASFNGRRMLDYIHRVYQEKIEMEKKKMKEGLEEI